MSTTPPNMPPAGGPIPPYDPRNQWKAYQAQQKAVWRAQRRAMRYATPRAPSIVAPILLIAIGVVALLLVGGHIAAEQFWAWYGRWWPVFLIVAGLGLLAEWIFDARHSKPIRRGGGFVGLIVLLALVGVAAAGWQNMGFPFHGNFGGEGELFNWGLPEHSSEQDPIMQPIPANALINVQNSRGDISITAGDTQQIEVRAQQVAYAASDAKAKKIFAREAAQVTVSGNSVLVKSDSPKYGRVNLTIVVPRDARVAVNAARGEVTAAGLRTGLELTAPKGSVHLNDLAGAVRVHMTEGDYDLSVRQLQGDLSIDGKFNQLTLSGVKGRINFRGEVYGGAHGENLTGPLDLRTSVTQLQLTELPGEFSLTPELLRVEQAKGKTRAVTHSKDIDLSQISGEIYVEGRDGEISLEPAGSFEIEAKNTKGDLSIMLPAGLSANVEAHTRNGEILSDYPAPNNNDGQNKSAAFKVGAGGKRISLSAENGDVRIKRGAAALPVSPMPPAPGVPHLKGPKTPQKAVTQ